MALTNKLTAIADAIRGKTGKTEEMTLDQMPLEIAGIVAGGGFPNIEVVTIASSFTLANSAYNVFFSMVNGTEQTYFVRKTKAVEDATCLLACFNLPVSTSNNGYARWRPSGGITAASFWTATYDLVANAGDEYYKVVIS